MTILSLAGGYFPLISNSGKTNCS